MVLVEQHSLLERADLSRTIPENARKLSELVIVQQRILDVDKHSVFIHEACPPGNHYSKATIVFLHGQAYTSNTWVEHETLRTIAALGYHCIAPDLPGNGRTRGPSLSQKNKPLFMLDFIAALGVKKVMIVAASMSSQYVLPLLSHDVFICLVAIALSNTHEIMHPSTLKTPVLVLWERGMNFFKRKFSFNDEECDSDITTVAFDDPIGPSPPSAFSFQSIANKVSSTISAPTSPARTGESLVAALEKALQDRSRGYPVMGPDAKILLVIDNPTVDWSKYFRSPNDSPVRVEQADFLELDMMCTEHSCVIEINQQEKDKRSFCPDACFIGCWATKSSRSKTILRALIASNIPFLNSHSSLVAFMDRNNLKKQLRKIHYTDGTKIPFLPSVHYPHFHKFHPTTSFPAVVTVNEGYQGYGKMKINTKEELLDVEGLIQLLGKGDTEVEVEPFVDLKYDLHVQKIGEDYKTFIRRSISRNWKSNVGSSVLEQIPTSERHKQYIQAICCHVGHMNVCSIDVLISKEGFEYVHAINDCLVYYGESQESDRRNLCNIVKSVLHRNVKTYRHVSKGASHDENDSANTGKNVVSQSLKDQLPLSQSEWVNEVPFGRNIPTFSSSYGSSPHNLTEKQLKGARLAPSSALKTQHQKPPQQLFTSSQSAAHNESVSSNCKISTDDLALSVTTTTGGDSSYGSLADDTMSQLKRTFAGIFGDVN